MMNRRQLILGAGAAVAALVLPKSTYAMWGGSNLTDNMISILKTGLAYNVRFVPRYIALQEFNESADNSDISPANVSNHCPNVNELAFVNELNSYRASKG